MPTIQMQNGTPPYGTQPEKKAGFLGRVIVRTGPHYYNDEKRLKSKNFAIDIGAKVTENTREIAATEYPYEHNKGIFEPLRRAMIAGYSVLAGGFCSLLNPKRTFHDLFIRDSRGKVNERAETAINNLDEKSDDWALKLYSFCERAPMHQLSDDTLVKLAKKAVEAWDHHVVIEPRKTYADTFSQTDIKTYADMTAQTDSKTYADITSDDAISQTDIKTYTDTFSQTDTPETPRAEVSNTSTRTHMNPFRPQITQESIGGEKANNEPLNPFRPQITQESIGREKANNEPLNPFRPQITQESIGGEETDTEPPVSRTNKSFRHTDTTNLQTDIKTYADTFSQTDTPEKPRAGVSNTSTRTHMNPFRPQTTQASIGREKTDTEPPVSRTNKSFRHTDTTNTRNTPLQVNINPASGVADNAYFWGTLGGYWQGNSDGFNRGYRLGEDHERDAHRHHQEDTHLHHQSGLLDRIGGFFHHPHHQG